MAFTASEAEALLGEVFAPWVQELGLVIEAIENCHVMLRLPFSDRLCREGGIICGQALMAAADTAMVFAVAAASGRYRPMTTVDLTTHFLRPAASHDVLVTARPLRLGRTMAFGQIELVVDGDPRPVAAATAAYALLPEPAVSGSGS